MVSRKDGAFIAFVTKLFSRADNLAKLKSASAATFPPLRLD
jgi:hypothetical protein